MMTIDDALYQQALEMADGDLVQSEIFRESMKASMRVNAAKHLATLGAKAPTLEDVPRRCSELIL